METPAHPLNGTIFADGPNLLVCPIAFGCLSSGLQGTWAGDLSFEFNPNYRVF